MLGFYLYVCLDVCACYVGYLAVLMHPRRTLLVFVWPAAYLVAFISVSFRYYSSSTADSSMVPSLFAFRAICPFSCSGSTSFVISLCNAISSSLMLDFIHCQRISRSFISLYEIDISFLNSPALHRPIPLFLDFLHGDLAGSWFPNSCKSFHSSDLGHIAVQGPRAMSRPWCY